MTFDNLRNHHALLPTKHTAWPAADRFDGGLLPKALPFNGRIVNGTDADIEQHPFQISMAHFGRHRCGGSIVSPQLIVTAAHCIRGAIRRFTTIRAGSTLHQRGGIVIQVTRALEHEDWNVPIAHNNDVGLLFLAEPLTYGRGIQPIVMPAPFLETAAGASASITGWGTQEQGAREVPAILQEARVPIISNEECARAYFGRIVITDEMLCAGLLETGGVDTCQGDSGGPLVVDGLLHGIVSFGYGCAKAGNPGVYARTSHFIDWIESKRYQPL